MVLPNVTWLNGLIEKTRDRMAAQQAAQIQATTIHTSSAPVCEFCGKKQIFGHPGLGHWFMCEECAEKIKQKLKIILDFK